MQMIIVKLMLVGLLATSSVFASAIKGLSSEQEPKALKGVERLVSSPVEYQRRGEWSKTSGEPKLEQQRVELTKTQERDEQQQLQQLPEQFKLEEQREEQLISQQKEELPPPPPPASKTLRYEAKPQVEQQYESTKELKREEAPVKAPARKEEPSKFIEQQRVEAASYEQLQQQQLKEQVELRDYEQRKLEDQQAAAVQFQQQQQQQQFEEQRQIIAKGASKELIAQAPIQSAEPEPYAFEYAIEGSSRRESGDAQGVVRGQYTLQQADGTSRVVDYVADRNGFRAQVNTNEFGTESQAPLAAPLAGVKGAPPAPAAVKGAPLAAQLPEIKQEPLKQEIAYVEEVPRAAVKGAVKLIEQAEIKAEVKAPAKGQQQEPLKSLDEPTAQAELLPVVKSAELRSPKAMGAAPKTRSGFESATAHRPVVGVLRHEYTHSQVVRESPLVVAHQQPQRHYVAPARHYVAPARHYSLVRPIAPAAHYPRQQPSAAASLLRSQLQHDRYLPTPIQPIVNRAPANSRVISFYSTSNNAETSEDLPIGFEKSA